MTARHSFWAKKCGMSTCSKLRKGYCIIADKSSTPDAQALSIHHSDTRGSKARILPYFRDNHKVSSIPIRFNLLDISVPLCRLPPYGENMMEKQAYVCSHWTDSWFMIGIRLALESQVPKKRFIRVMLKGIQDSPVLYSLPIIEVAPWDFRRQ